MSPTTSDLAGGQQVAEVPPRLKRVNSGCKTCAATVIRLQLTSYRHIWHWLVDTPCGHSRLCRREKWCPACAESPILCVHCTHTHCPCCGAEWVPTKPSRPLNQNASEAILEHRCIADPAQMEELLHVQNDRVRDHSTTDVRPDPPEPRPDRRPDREA